MREIKFRGKTKDGEWVYGYVDATSYKDLVVIHSVATTYEVLSETVGQYTGLEDVNGKEVFGVPWLLDMEPEGSPVEDLKQVCEKCQK